MSKYLPLLCEFVAYIAVNVLGIKTTSAHVEGTVCRLCDAFRYALGDAGFALRANLAYAIAPNAFPVIAPVKPYIPSLEEWLNGADEEISPEVAPAVPIVQTTSEPSLLPLTPYKATGALETASYGDNPHHRIVKTSKKGKQRVLYVPVSEPEPGVVYHYRKGKRYTAKRHPGVPYRHPGVPYDAWLAA